MTRSPEPVPFPKDPRDPDEGGGWSGFLSESSEELQGIAAADAPLAFAERPTTPATAIDPDKTIGLDEIVARQVPVQWADAVAIVEELCQVLLDGPGPLGIPEAGDVSITSDGRVVISRGARRAADISRLAVILRTLLPVVSTPLALRLFVTGSMSAERYPSIERFAEALAHYAAPNADRAVLIRDLCRRSLAFPAGLVPVAPIGAGVERARALKVPVARGRARVWVAVAAALLVFGAVTAVVMRPRSGVTPARASAAAPVPAPVAVASSIPTLEPSSSPARQFARPEVVAPQAALPAPVETFQTARAPVPIVGRDRPEREGTVAPVPPRRPPEAPKAAPDGPALQALPLAPSSAAITRAPAVGDQLASRAPRETPRVPEPAPRPAPVGTAGIAPEPRIYSSADIDVQPPVLLTPKPTLPGFADNVTSTIEVLVDEQGGVRSVKWAGPTLRLSDGLVMSPAKLMKFQPASRNGRPVPYRLYMTLTSPPAR